MRVRNEYLIFAAILALFLVKKSMASDSDFFRYDALFKKYAKVYGVPWRWIKAICIVESNLGRAPSVKRGILNPSDIEASKSSDGKSWGLMQTTLANARERFGMMITPAWLNSPENSVKAGTAYLGYLVSLFGLDLEKVSRAYNGGPGYAKTALGKTLTPLYYAKVKNALEEVMRLQPGKEIEI